MFPSKMLRLSWSSLFFLTAFLAVMDVCRWQAYGADADLGRRATATKTGHFARTPDSANARYLPSRVLSTGVSVADQKSNQPSLKQHALVSFCRKNRLVCLTIPALSGKGVNVPLRWTGHITSIDVANGTADDYFCRFYRELGGRGPHFDVDKNGFSGLDVSTSMTPSKIHSFVCRTSAPAELKTSERWHWPEDSLRLCSRVDEVWVNFKLSSERGSGTWDTIWLTFKGLGEGFQGAKPRGIIIAKSPSSGEIYLHRLDLRRLFGLDTIALDQITALELVTKKTNKILGGDEWQVEGLTLQARCAGTGISLTVDKYSSLQESFRLNPWVHTPSNGMGYPVWLGRIKPNDWKAQPLCSHIRDLEVHISVGYRWWAGTDNSLVVNIGNAKAVMANASRRGWTYTLFPNIWTAYGIDEVPINKLQTIKIWNIGLHIDMVFLRDITIRARCSDSGKLQVARKKIGKWITQDGSWKSILLASDWRDE